jgi:putative hydrolase of the HAD superfamily
MTKITHLFFDLGGVCLTNGWDFNSRKKAAELFDYDFEGSEKRHKQIVEKFETGKISRENYLNEMIFYEKRDFSEADFIDFMESLSQPYESSFEVLEKLSSQGNYNISTLNNESLELNLFRIKKFGLKRYFIDFFSSSFLGVKKPDADIFQMVLLITQTVGEECLMIDDREKNIEGAKKCGFQTLHLPHVEDLEKLLIDKGII